jgi:hypothetical protein
MNPPKYVPPLMIDRVLITYAFEEGGYVAIVAGGKVDTAEAMDVIELLIAEKRKELERKAALT